MEEKYKLLKFIDGEIELDIRFSIDENTVWLSQKEMAPLFEMSTDNISLHIKNILKTIDNNNSVVEESSVTASDGKTYKTKLYNLDIMLAVGYTTKQNISNHIINIFNDCEFEKNSVVKKFFTTATDGKTYNVDYFNLDMVLSVGYRVNSKRGIEFRRNEYCRLS